MEQFGKYSLIRKIGTGGMAAAVDFAAAQPDPLADVAASIIAHMNDDHREALKLYCEHFAAIPADERHLYLLQERVDWPWFIVSQFVFL
jgi:hypothetical protein